MKTRKLIVLALLISATLRIVSPEIRDDFITFILILLASILLLLPKEVSLNNILPYIKRFSIPNFLDIEFQKKVEKVGKAITNTEEKISKEFRISDRFTKYNSEIDKIIDLAGRDPISAFLKLSMEIEKEARQRLSQENAFEANRFISMPKLLERGAGLGIFPKQIIAPFKDFWSIRNQIVHGELINPNSQLVTSLLATGIDVLRIISSEKDKPTS